MEALRAWSGARVLAVALGWVLAAAVLVVVYARVRVGAARRGLGPGEPFYHAVQVPAGWLLLLGPPLALLAAWLWVRLSRPAA